MKKLNYKDQLLHPNWQRKRLEMLEDANWECAVCFCKDETLHVHHRRYLRGHMVWEYENADLMVLCSACHEKEHMGIALLDELLARNLCQGSIVRDVVALVAAEMFMSHEIDDDLARRCFDYVDANRFVALAAIMKAELLSDKKQIAKILRDAHTNFCLGPQTFEKRVAGVLAVLEDGEQDA